MVECLFGNWKRRFPCLRSTLDTALIVIVAVGVLHNIAIKYRDLLDDSESKDTGNEEKQDESNEEVDAKNSREGIHGRQKRDLLTHLHFTR